MLSLLLYGAGIICISLATVISIIIGIYYWGAADYELSKAAWEGAKMWLWMVGGGFIVMIIGMLIDSNGK